MAERAVMADWSGNEHDSFGADLLNELADVLTVLMGHAELLGDHCRSSGDAEACELADAIGLAAPRCKELMARYFSFVRDWAVAHLPIELNALVAELEPALATSAGSHVRLILGLAPRPLQVLGARRQLAEMIRQLVADACDAVTRGGEVDIALDELYLERPLGGGGNRLCPGRFAVIEVREHGVASADDERVGLGLRHVHHIVRQHRGAILVDRQPMGTRVRVLLPSAPDTVQ